MTTILEFAEQINMRVRTCYTLLMALFVRTMCTLCINTMRTICKHLFFILFARGTNKYDHGNCGFSETEFIQTVAAVLFDLAYL